MEQEEVKVSEEIVENENQEEKVEKVEVEEKAEPTLEEQNELLKKEIVDWKRAYAIKLADFENYKKRKDKEFDEYKKYACESVIIKQVEALDVLSIAIESAKSNHDIDALLAGLEMIKNSMNTYLKEEGLEEIDTENQKYDPYIHHAVQTVSLEEAEDDTVVKVLQKGYKLKGKVIRPAMVSINKK